MTSVAWKGGDRPALGVVGVGSLGFHHARIATDLGGVRMAGVFDSDPNRATEVASTFGVDAHATLDSLLDRCDGLVIATPTHSHEDVATQALERGISVFVEKPIAPDLSAADRMLAAAEAGDGFIQVGHVRTLQRSVPRGARVR